MLIAMDDGQWVSEDFARLAEVVRDYDSALELRWIPQGQRESDAEKKNPYCIFDTRSNSVVMFASERDTPQGILARLWGADNTKHDVLKKLDIENNAAQAMKLKGEMDDEEMRRDFTAFLIGTKKNYIKTTSPITGKKLKLDDQLRSI